VASVLVTGASGFIGSRLCDRLVALGHEVHATSRSKHEATDIRWWQVDLSDVDATRAVVHAAAPDAIVHLASLVYGAPDIELVWPTLNSNLVSTVSLLDAAASAGGPRVLVAGTMMEPDHEGAAGVAGSPYAVAKAASSAYARMFHVLYGLPVTVLRLFMVYGPGQPVRKLIPHVIVSLSRDEAPTVSSGRWEIDWVYVDDVVDAIVRAIHADGIAGTTLDIGSGELVTMRAVVERLAELVGSPTRPRFGAQDDRPNEVPRAADVETTRAVLGWTGATSLDDGLLRTIEWYRRELAAGGIS
jgi:nucleoside-diphosphate-sugar epimerase